jgi:hypothetical protein
VAVDICVRIGHKLDGFISRYIDLGEVTGCDRDEWEAYASGKGKTDSSKAQTATINESFGVMDSVDTEVNKERSAVHFLLKVFPVSLCL